MTDSRRLLRLSCLCLIYAPAFQLSRIQPRDSCHWAAWLMLMLSFIAYITPFSLIFHYFRQPPPAFSHWPPAISPADAISLPADSFRQPLRWLRLVTLMPHITDYIDISWLRHWFSDIISFSPILITPACWLPLPLITLSFSLIDIDILSILIAAASRWCRHSLIPFWFHAFFSCAELSLPAITTLAFIELII